MSNQDQQSLVLWNNQLGMHDVDRVGGKNASLGEMITNLSSLGVSVPNGFATTSDAFNQFLDQSGLNQRIYALLDITDIDDVAALAQAGKQIRQWVVDTPFQPASLFNDRAISYRVHQGYDHRGVALSAGVQRMVRSDLAASGVMFTIDTESGFDQVVFITSAWGLGEMVVQGAVNPDEFYVHKPTLAANRPAIVRRTMGSKKIRMVYADSQTHGEQVRIEDVEQATRDRFSLTDDEVQALARQAVLIE